MNGALRKAILGVVVGAGVVTFGGSVRGDCICPNCCADPVFVQRDLRQRERVHQLRQERMRRLKKLDASRQTANGVS
ncbi:MAG: hypothetical protein AMS16_03290 [Planctomycetes bacterium DG_58]|nr:MAG: hypothetical protein AMS16_03290 [Planctomycetes bacterium DG_58]